VALAYSPVRSVRLGTAPAQLRLYPNPARTAVQVAGLTAGAKIAVYDARGRLVLHASADAFGKATLPAHLVQGVYLVRSAGQAARLQLGAE